MPRLFAYGTLRDEAVQRAVFGRRLAGHADELHGFERSTVMTGDSDTTYPILRYDGKADSRVEGIVFEISGTDLARADRYEGAAYRRIEVRLASCTQAWVYVDPGACPAGQQALRRACPACPYPRRAGSRT